MKSETDLVVQHQEIQPANVLQMILQLSADPNARIDVIERLVALQERQEDRQRKTAYIAAMSRVAAKLLPIKKGATFFDIFSGTTAVGHHFKKLGYTVYSNDFLEFAYSLARTNIETNAIPKFNLDEQGRQ